jgi:hypothetical protein
MKKISIRLFLSCQKATELIEKKSVFPLNRLDGFRLFIHKKICKACNQYAIQSKLIDNFLAQKSASSLKKVNQSPPNLKEDILKKLK